MPGRGGRGGAVDRPGAWRGTPHGLGPAGPRPAPPDRAGSRPILRGGATPLASVGSQCVPRSRDPLLRERGTRS